MPSSTRKTIDPKAFARSGRTLCVCIALTLAGCQVQGNRPPSPQVDSDHQALEQPINWSETAKPQEPTDVWERIRSGYQLQDEIGINPRIERQRLWFASNPVSVERSSQRGSPYIHYVVEQLDERNMPMELALLPIIESAYNPLAYSPANAAGIWQFIPATGRSFNLRQTNWYDGRRDIMASTHAAMSYLTRLHDMFNGDWLLALAAYNSGEGTVSRAIERNQKLGLPTDYWNLSLPKETQDYVPKLLALSQVINSPQAYGIDLNPIANQPYFEVVEFKQRLQLSSVAEMAQVEEAEIIQLNPAFKKGVTIDGPQHVLVPSEKAELLAANLLLMKPQEQLDWRQHRVRKGENLASIANRYKTSTDSIKDLNQLASNHLKPGQVLSIAVAPGQTFSPQPEPREPLINKTPQRYVVRKGDSLDSIAKQQKVKIQELQRWNKLSNSRLKLGQVLVLQESKSPVTAALKSLASSKSASKTNLSSKAANRQMVTYYKVQQGDSLYQIAKRFKVDLQQLQNWNPSTTHALKLGQTLTLYTDK
ncbi:MAG: LysM peptidoglycan-binding domain-containing protein [Pseudomonas sp.]|uniref:lytic transglycosylase domain-containing protein n=1 Tax=Pseudomonas sp. TaxID=306 RepID=UPI0027357069|nr:lytic transglycosylase domain-containing protein [Pseudomonas sp.]MDP3848120.1 LysM peptidoglycan-binding domain-containing protein [Pseudomonas sp.]